MSVKVSISLTDAQNTYARDLVARRRYPSLSAVLQEGLKHLRSDLDAEAAGMEALRLLIEQRRAGAFVNLAESRERTERMIACKKIERGL